jgi:hypothetical protein
MKTKSISTVHSEARKEFVKFFGLEVYENAKTLFIALGLIMGFLGCLFLALHFYSPEWLFSKKFFAFLGDGLVIFAFLCFIALLFARKRMVQVQRMTKEFKGVINAKTMKHFLVRNENFREIPFFSQELARFVMNGVESSIFQQPSLNILNNIFSYLEEKGLGFKFDGIFFEGILEFNFKDNDFPAICVVALGDKEKADEVAKTLKKDYSVKNQKEPLFARFIDFVYGEEKSGVGLNFKITETCEKLDYHQEIILEFPDFYPERNKNNI